MRLLLLLLLRVRPMRRSLSPVAACPLVREILRCSPPVAVGVGVGVGVVGTQVVDTSAAAAAQRLLHPPHTTVAAVAVAVAAAAASSVLHPFPWLLLLQHPHRHSRSPQDSASNPSSRGQSLCCVRIWASCPDRRGTVWSRTTRAPVPAVQSTSFSDPAPTVYRSDRHIPPRHRRHFGSDP